MASFRTRDSAGSKRSRDQAVAAARRIVPAGLAASPDGLLRGPSSVAGLSLRST